MLFKTLADKSRRKREVFFTKMGQGKIRIKKRANLGIVSSSMIE